MDTKTQIDPDTKIDQMPMWQAAERIKNCRSDDVSINSMHRHGKGWVVLFWKSHKMGAKLMSEPVAGCAYLADDYNDTVVRCV